MSKRYRLLMTRTYHPPTPYLRPGPMPQPDEWFNDLESLRSRLIELDRDRNLEMVVIKDEHGKLVEPYRVRFRKCAEEIVPLARSPQQGDSDTA